MAKVFVACTWDANLRRVIPCHHWRCKLLWLLGLVSTMTHLFPVIHINWSYSFSRKQLAVITIVSFACIKDCKELKEGCMHVTNWIFGKHPLPQFCLKLVCKKGGGYFRELMVVENTAKIRWRDKKCRNKLTTMSFLSCLYNFSHAILTLFCTFIFFFL